MATEAVVSSPEKTIDRLRRESPAFAKMLVAWLLPARLRPLLHRIVSEHLVGDLHVEESDLSRIFEQMDGRAKNNPDCWDAQELVSHIEGRLLPLLKANKGPRSSPPSGSLEFPSRPASLPQGINKLHKVPLGFGQATPSVPTILLGQESHVREAVKYVLRENALSRVLYFSHETSGAQQQGGDWKTQEGRTTKLRAPSWDMCLHKVGNLEATSGSLLASLKEPSFDLLLIDNIGAVPGDADLCRTLLPRALGRAEKVCKRMMRWGRTRNTSLVLGVHVGKEGYRQAEFLRLSQFCAVYLIIMDDGVLCAQDSQGYNHPLDD